MAAEDKSETQGIEHQEIIGDVATQAMKTTAEAAAQGQGTTGYESLSIWQTVKTFKMNAFICFLVTFSAATDGYQIAYVSQRTHEGEKQSPTRAFTNFYLGLSETSSRTPASSRSLEQTPTPTARRSLPRRF
jgi:hypothetical protein